MSTNLRWKAKGEQEMKRYAITFRTLKKYCRGIFTCKKDKWCCFIFDKSKFYDVKCAEKNCPILKRLKEAE